MIKNLLLKIPIVGNAIILFYRSLRKLVVKPPKVLEVNSEKSYKYLSEILTKKDSAELVSRPELIPLHEKLDSLRIAQMKNWNSFVYCHGYYYQGYQRIGINGIKPTEPRMNNYSLSNYFNKSGAVLDIGSNSGFLSCFLCDYYNKVTGIELNPFLIQMGEETAKYLKIKNVEFIEGDFISYNFDKKFDAIFSLSNHFTIDGNLNISFESYIAKTHSLLNNHGYLFFESHDINGDDSDLDEKFAVASKYYTLIDYKMVKAFYPADIDKLFAIFKKNDEDSSSPVVSSFKLSEAKKSYSYHNTSSN